MLGNDRKIAMRNSMCFALGALATIVLAGCDQAEPAPASGLVVSTPAASQVTLPPPRTPTASPLPPPEPSLEPTSAVPGPLSADGPWLLFCGQTGEAGLMDVDGPGRLFPGVPCLRSEQVSSTAGFALDYGNLVQFPGGEEVREFSSDAAVWSADGNLALRSDIGLNPGEDGLLVYDVAADRGRPLINSEFELIPLGLSPGGTWAVYVERDVRRDHPPHRQPWASLMAASADGKRVVEAYGLSNGRFVNDTVRGWFSESTLLISRTDPEDTFGLYALELLLVDLNTVAVRPIFGQHSDVALDPVTRTVLLEATTPRQRNYPNNILHLVRLSAADGWVPHSVTVPEGWDDDWMAFSVEWHPELGQFSVLVGRDYGMESLHFLLLDPDGTIGQDFPLGDPLVIADWGLFPSPNGERIVVGAPTTHGTRLYDRNGRLIKVLWMEGQERNLGVTDVLWLPDGEAFFLVDLESNGLFRASARQGWEPALVQSTSDAGADLMLVQPPVLPFRHACNWPTLGRQRACQLACSEQDYTRLHEGDRVAVSQEPPLSSRVRSSPQISGPVVGVLEPGEEADLLVGPVCGDGYLWWYVAPENGSAAGWVAEGDAEGAWLVPIEMEP